MAFEIYECGVNEVKCERKVMTIRCDRTGWKGKKSIPNFHRDSWGAKSNWVSEEKIKHIGSKFFKAANRVYTYTVKT